MRAEVSDRLLTLTPDRPERRNAVDPQMRDKLAADTDLRSGMLAESLAQTALLGSEDHREGLAAARERRSPEFAGR